MPSASLESLIKKLEAQKRDFELADAIERLLNKIGKRKIDDLELLIRFHEALLFIRAYPANTRILKLADQLLDSFFNRISGLRNKGIDISLLDYIEYSGIAGTILSGTFSFGIAEWLLKQYPDRVDVDWENYKRKHRLASLQPRLIPFLYEESLVEANVPHLEWFNQAKGTRSSLQYIVERIAAESGSSLAASEMYDSLELPIRWELKDSRASRTNNRSRPRQVFFHKTPLIKRSDVSLPEILNQPSIQFDQLSERDGERVLDRVKDTTTVRYRELYGITNGDPAQVSRIDVGRGIEMYLWGLRPDRRLPLRAYHAGYTLKNGIPINYIEAISISDRAELGFNTFYTFRDGESAWIYAQVLRVLRDRVGITCFSIDPYQLGFNNDEAIESGAFWFYRKLGFRPTDPDIAEQTRNEEKKLRTFRGYRSSAGTLKKLSRGTAVFEIPGTEVGFWDGFSVRNLGFAIQEHSLKEFGGDPQRMKSESDQEISNAVGLKIESLSSWERKAVADLAIVYSMIADLGSWSRSEKEDLKDVILAKLAFDESDYSRAMQRHARLREAVRNLGRK